MAHNIIESVCSPVVVEFVRNADLKGDITSLHTQQLKTEAGFDQLPLDNGDRNMSNSTMEFQALARAFIPLSSKQPIWHSALTILK